VLLFPENCPMRPNVSPQTQKSLRWEKRKTYNAGATLNPADCGGPGLSSLLFSRSILLLVASFDCGRGGYRIAVVGGLPRTELSRVPRVRAGTSICKSAQKLVRMVGGGAEDNPRKVDQRFFSPAVSPTTVGAPVEGPVTPRSTSSSLSLFGECTGKGAGRRGEIVAGRMKIS
jgi:hypothetical protein